MLPFWNFACPIASFGYIVESLTQFTAIASWLFAIDANIEKLTVFWISVSWMCCSYWLINFWTSKLEQFCHLQIENVILLAHQNHFNSKCTLWWATMFLGFVRPSADSSALIEHQARWTCNHIELPIDTIEKSVTNVLVRKITIQSWTIWRWFRFLWAPKKNMKFINLLLLWI